MTTLLLICIAIGALIFVGGMHLIDRPAVAEVEAGLADECHPRGHGPLTLEVAHIILQDRRECDVATCAEKRRAWLFLVDAGRVRPGRWAVR